jgi:hypothetical protein
MTPEEHQLIHGLFERMRALGAIEKDQEAEAFIMQSVLATPDAAYKLVQSLLVLEQTLEDVSQRNQQLEAQVQQMQTGLAAAPQRSGGFLGGLFGGSKPSQPAPMPRAAGSVPMAGRGASPWGQQPSMGYQQAGPYQQQPMQPQRSGGGFMKTAMATAAGVAGGVLVAGAIRDMMGGGQAQAGTGAGGTGASPYEVGSKGGEQAAQEPQYQDPNDNDPGNYEEDTGAQDEGGGGWFGGDGGSDSSEF